MFETAFLDRLFRAYYFCKFYPFRKERRARRTESPRQGFVGLQIDGLSHAHFQQARKLGHLPHIDRHLRKGYVLRRYRAGIPSSTPAAQGLIFYDEDRGIPGFRWYEKDTGKVITCNDPADVQYFREKLFGNREGLLAGGSSYSNILDGGAARSIFTVSSPHPQTLFGRFGGLRFLLLILLHPLRVGRMVFATVVEYFTEIYDRWQVRRSGGWQVDEGLFPFIRIFCNVILRELQTFGVIADIYAGVPWIYTTYSGYDELAHHFGPASRPALKNLRYIDQRIGEILRMLRHAPGRDYHLVILSDHGQTPAYPFQSRFGATLGEAVSAFLREHQQAAVSAGPLEFTRAQLDYLNDELEARPRSWRHHLNILVRRSVQRRIRELVPETLKVDHEGGVVITYSSSLAHLYITGEKRRLNWREIEEGQPLLLRFLQQHKGIGFVVAEGPDEEVCFFHRGGRLCARAHDPPARAELAFLEPYGDPGELFPDLCRFAGDPRCGDLILFGAYDGRALTCFDDQVGGHGSVGGEQQYPFLILPEGHPVLARRDLAGYRFLYREVFAPLRWPERPP